MEELETTELHIKDINKFAGATNSQHRNLVLSGDGRPTYELQGQCDERNRRILDSTYKELGLDPSKPSVIAESSYTDPDHHRTATTFILKQVVGAVRPIAITEVYATIPETNWESFRVYLSGVEADGQY